MPAITAYVHGRVQGVGFRYWASRRACALGLSGHARNLADGSVEVYAEGPPEALRALAEALREGPVASRVERVDVVPGALEQGCTGFRVE
jgi:acylphosphatase